MSETVYVKFERNTMIYEKKVNIGEIATVYATNKALQAKVRAIKLLNIPDVKKGTYVFSVMNIIERISKECPEAEINNIGESDFIIEYREKPPKKGIWNVLKIFVTCVIVFIGSMFTIMAYNNDIGVSELFEKIYELVGGEQNGILELSYSIGLTLGIAVFYNHFVGKKLSDTPTPVEVQMRSYESDVDTAVVERASRKKEEYDAS